jgi:hypothetical protein
MNAGKFAAGGAGLVVAMHAYRTSPTFVFF